MQAETPRSYTENEISEAMEFWGEWPEMGALDKLDAQALKEGLEASGLNLQVIDENTDFSKLPPLGRKENEWKKEER